MSEWTGEWLTPVLFILANSTERVYKQQLKIDKITVKLNKQAFKIY